jgi:hypothetical protein
VNEHFTQAEDRSPFLAVIQQPGTVVIETKLSTGVQPTNHVCMICT